MNLSTIYVIVTSTLVQNIYSHWNPRIHECNYDLNPFICKPLIDGSIEPDANSIEADAELILQENDMSKTMEILSNRNFWQREAIDKRYSEKDPSKKIFTHFSDHERYPVYSELLSELLMSVPDQYVAHLLTAATAPEDSECTDLHGSTIFMAILGGMSNKGLEYLDSEIRSRGSEDVEVSLGRLMKHIGGYPNNFISLVVDLLKAERDESAEIDMKLYNEDLKMLKKNLEQLNFLDELLQKNDNIMLQGLTEVERHKQPNETFLCEILTKRSFLHLNKLFKEDHQTRNFAYTFLQTTPDDFLGQAIVELYAISINRVNGLAWILHKKRRSPYIFTIIIVSRSEIDLGSIIQVYNMISDNTLYDDVVDNYHELTFYVNGLFNIINPPDEIAWKDE